MAEVPPLLEPVYEGLDTMVIELPGPPPETGATTLVIQGVALAALCIACGAVGPQHPGLFWPLALLAALVIGGVIVRDAIRDDQARHRLRFRPGRLQIDDRDLYLAEVREVRWDCDPPLTTLRLVMQDGSVSSLVCARRGQGGGVGVTRKQREWVSALIQSAIDHRGGAIPEAMARLLEHPPDPS